MRVRVRVCVCAVLRHQRIATDGRCVAKKVGILNDEPETSPTEADQVPPRPMILHLTART